MGAKLKRNISGFFEIPYEQYCIDEDGEFCSCVLSDKVYIKEVIYNDPVTVILWSDGTKTVSKAHGGDVYSKETGLAICTVKKLLGSNWVREVFEDWIQDGTKVTIKDVRDTLKVNKHPVVAESVAVEVPTPKPQPKKVTVATKKPVKKATKTAKKTTKKK